MARVLFLSEVAPEAIGEGLVVMFPSGCIARCAGMYWEMLIPAARCLSVLVLPNSSNRGVYLASLGQYLFRPFRCLCGAPIAPTRLPYQANEYVNRHAIIMGQIGRGGGGAVGMGMICLSPKS